MVVFEQFYTCHTVELALVVVTRLALTDSVSVGLAMLAVRSVVRCVPVLLWQACRFRHAVDDPRGVLLKPSAN